MDLHYNPFDEMDELEEWELPEPEWSLEAEVENQEIREERDFS